MKQFLLPFLLLLLPGFRGQAQNTFTALIRDAESKEPLVGVSAVLGTVPTGGSSDGSGLVTITGIPDGRHTILFSYVGYETRRESFLFPLPQTAPFLVLLRPDGQRLDEVVVAATRSSRSIRDLPTRVEAITAEELDEKAAMNSANIAMLLRESTGIQVQQTSATSANASIRIQGLDGRYTQILRDGFPLYGGFASGLSIMQIPPLDLKQVEVIKGSASTLYGGGAIAGLVNLVSKTPEQERELSLMLNQTSALCTTLTLFYGERSRKTGLTLYAAATHQSPYDPNADGFSDIPRIRSLAFNPRFFYYPSERTTLSLGLNTAFENRVGGDVQAIRGEGGADRTFTERNLSDRVSSQLQFDYHLSEEARFSVKNSVSWFGRRILVPGYSFAGRQLASFTEATYALEKENTDWIIGGNRYTDAFTEPRPSPGLPGRDYQNTTLGAFAQNTWRVSPAFSMESGLRTDYNTVYGPFVLPRLSALYKITPGLSARLGGGLGYKVPAVFTEEAERLAFRGILPIDPNHTEAERSRGGNFDLNYRTSFGDGIIFSVNQLFFLTRLEQSLVLGEGQPTGAGVLRFENAHGPVASRGLETNLKLAWEDLSLFVNYAFIDARLRYRNLSQQKSLTPRHTAGLTLMYENEAWRVGYELYYTGRQYLSDRTRTRDFWMMGFMAMRTFRKVSLFLNFENFTDARQSRYQPLVLPPFRNPSFAEIWAPTDGFVANAGIKVSL
ncbi:TonB-dependent receptor [soil metagenome]